MKIKRLFIKNNIFLITSFSFLFLFFFSSSVLGADYYKIDKGKSREINDYSPCKKVTNNCALAIFVPTKSSAQWTSFRENKPSCVTLSNCSTGGGTTPSNCTVLQPNVSTGSMSCKERCQNNLTYKECVSIGSTTGAGNGEWKRYVWDWPSITPIELACGQGDGFLEFDDVEVYDDGDCNTKIEPYCKYYKSSFGTVQYKKETTYCLCCKPGTM